MSTSLRRLSVAGLLLLSGCTHGLAALRQPPTSYAAVTAPPFSSLIFAARTSEAVIVVDLGWYGGHRALRHALAAVAARPEEVTDVFLTHSHRDHVGSWPLLRRARYHLAAAEVETFQEARRHPDIPSRGGEILFGEPGPWPGEVDVRPFGSDTSFALGGDTLRAYLLPGHTRGSAAYLFRRTLFVGDAFAWNWLTGLRRPARLFTVNRRESAAALVRVLTLARTRGVDRVCNAHAKCFAADSAFVARLERWAR